METSAGLPPTRRDRSAPEGRPPTRHYLDALACALVARAVELGQTHLPEPGTEAERAATEGWIHLPTSPLQALAGG
jgi:hypothetical protein